MNDKLFVIYTRIDIYYCTQHGSCISTYYLSYNIEQGVVYLQISVSLFSIDLMSHYCYIYRVSCLLHSCIRDKYTIMSYTYIHLVRKQDS